MSTTVWSRGGNAQEDDDLWDDTELIKAYDESVRLFNKSRNKDGAESPQASGAKEQSKNSAPKRHKPSASPKKPAAKAPPQQQQLDQSANVASHEAYNAAQAQAYYNSYNQSYYGTSHGVAPSYFSPGIAAPLPPVQDEALSQLLMAWYNAGYQAGRYQALRGAPS